LDIPLVLHGGSDTPDEDIQRAIATGVDKINIWTDVRVAYLRAVRDFLATTTLEGYAFEQLMAAARQSVCAAAGQKMRVFGSAGKADGFCLQAAALEISL
jgi:fructose-bisphosphate aldolase class II